MIRYEPLRKDREIPPDDGMQGRRKLSRKFRMTLYHAWLGICFYCETRVDWHCFHVVHDEAVCLRGNDKMSNKGIAHPECHAAHTEEENPMIARCDRIGRKHRGEAAPKKPMACGKRTDWKRKVNGQTVRR